MLGRRVLVAALALALLGSSPLPTDRAADGARTPPPPASVLFSTAAAASGVLIDRVYADAARDDEFVELANAGTETVDLAGWALSDGEATAVFPLETRLPPGARLVATRNASSYAEDTLESADLTYDRGEVSRMEGGVLRLADAGDEVLLLDGSGAVVDAYVYGDSAYAGPGWTGPPARGLGQGEVAVRAWEAGFLIDGDSNEDWDGLRDYRLGQSAFEFGDRATVAPARTILSPDDGQATLLSLLASARSTIDVSVYTLTSTAIAATLAAAAERGVRVRVLLDGSPVGGIDEHGEALAESLAAGGVAVRELRGSPDVVKRYRYLHAKYAVVDGSNALISSENFGDAGFPPPEGSGNRGWSIILEDATLAADLLRIFEGDFDPRRRDSLEVDGRAAGPLPPPPGTSSWSPGPVAARRSRLVVSPDTALESDGLLGLLASAGKTIWIEAFYIEETWRELPNPFLEAAFQAAGRGVRVRILLDGSWWNTDETTAGNDDVAAHINARAAAEGLDLEVRLVEPAGRIERVHNKGVLVDGRTVFVSSLNWALSSATENREVGLLLEDPAIAAVFERALQQDWDGTSGSGGFRLGDPVALGAIYALVAVAAAGSLYQMRRGSKGLKPRPSMETRGRARAHLRGRRREVRLLPAELVAQPRHGARGGTGDRRGRDEARGGLGGAEGD